MHPIGTRVIHRLQNIEMLIIAARQYNVGKQAVISYTARYYNGVAGKFEIIELSDPEFFLADPVQTTLAS